MEWKLIETKTMICGERKKIKIETEIEKEDKHFTSTIFIVLLIWVTEIQKMEDVPGK